MFLFTMPSIWEIIYIISFLIIGGIVAPTSLLRYHRSTKKTKLWMGVNILLGVIFVFFVLSILIGYFNPS